MQSAHSIGEIQSNSSQYSNQSSNTFLAVPRQIDKPLQPQISQDSIEENNSSYQTYPPKKQVSFQNPTQNQKLENGESSEEQDFLISKQSLDKRSIYVERDSLGFSNYQQSINSSDGNQKYRESDRAEEYKGLKQFQHQMEKIVRRHNGKLCLERSRKSSENMLDHPQKSKDSFKISPQFKPQDGSQLLQIQLLSSMGQVDSILQNPNMKDQNEDYCSSPLSNGLLELYYNLTLFRNLATPNPHLLALNIDAPIQNWSRVTLIVITFVARLILAVKLPAFHNKFQLFKKRYFDLIGDQGSSFNFFKRLGLIKKIRNLEKKRTKNYLLLYFQRLNNDKYILDPSSQMRVFTIVFIYLFYILGIFWFIYESSFGTKSSLFCEILFIILVILDVCLIFNTALSQDGKFIRNRFSIFDSQKMQLFEDLVVIMALLLKIYLQNKYVGLIIVVRLFRVRAYNTELNYIADFYFNLYIHFKLCYLIFQYLLIGHICACILYIFSNDQQEWFDSINTDANSDIYIKFMSWSLLTLTTIGSNSLTLNNSLGQFFQILISIVSFSFIFLMFYQIGNMCNYLSDKEQQKIRLMLQCYNKRGLSIHLQYQLRKHYENQISCQRATFKDNNFWDQLSVELKRQVSLNLYSKVIRTSSLLKQTCSEECLNNLCTKFQHVSPEKGIELLQQGQICDKLFFILSGELTQIVQLPSRSRQIRSYGVGPLDEYQFLMQTTRQLSYTTKSQVQLGFIEQTDFLNTIKQYDEDFERISMLKHNLHHNQIVRYKSQVCQNCQYRGHVLQKCPFVHLVLDEDLILKQFNVNLPSVRGRFFRNDNKRFNTRLNKNLISITAISFSISQKFHREADLTNEVMNRLQGTHHYQDDSLFIDVEEKSPRPHLERQYTTFSRQADQILQTLKQSSQNTLGTATQRQNSISQSISYNDRDLSLYSSGKNQNLTNSINSIKVNVIKSSISSDHLVKQHEKLRLNKQRPTNSTGSIQRRERKKMSYMSANPPNNPLQQSGIMQQPNQSNSLIQNNYPSAQTYSNKVQQTNASPPTYESGHVFNGESGHVINSDQSPLFSNPTAVGSLVHQSIRVDFQDCDKIHHFKYFFPAYNFDLIAIRVNQKNRLTNHYHEDFHFRDKDSKKKFNTEQTIIYDKGRQRLSMK